MTKQDNAPDKPSQAPSIEDGIGIRLKTAREAKSMSQSDLHGKTGLSRTVLINYEAGRHKPGARELRLLCDALEVSPNQLIYGSEEPHALTIGLADTILNMGTAAILPSAVIVPMIGSMLGKDDTRMILSLLESLLKAKDPEGYALIMELLSVFTDATNLPQEKRNKLIQSTVSDPNTPDFVKKYLSNMSENARDKLKQL